jgi:hypothetical protein
VRRRDPTFEARSSCRLFLLHLTQLTMSAPPPRNQNGGRGRGRGGPRRPQAPRAPAPPSNSLPPHLAQQQEQGSGANTPMSIDTDGPTPTRAMTPVNAAGDHREGTFSQLKFTDLQLSPATMVGITQGGYVNATHVQAETIPTSLTGADVCVFLLFLSPFFRR